MEVADLQLENIGHLQHQGRLDRSSVNRQPKALGSLLVVLLSRGREATDKKARARGVHVFAPPIRFEATEGS
jgi:hypothetical protein